MPEVLDSYLLLVVFGQPGLDWTPDAGLVSAGAFSRRRYWAIRQARRLKRRPSMPPTTGSAPRATAA
jgi:hypothetical protein